MISINLPNKYRSNQAQLKDAFGLLLGKKNKYNYFVGVKFMSKDKIQAVNKQYRKLDKPTDVLSFPLFESIEELPTNDCAIGDLILCLEMMENDHLSFFESLVHGVIHLLGFDHEQNEAEWNQARKKVAISK